MQDKTKNIIIIIETIAIVVLIIFLILSSNEVNTNTENNNSIQNSNTINNEAGSENAEKKEYIKTYNIVEKLDITDENGNYDFYVVKQFQDNDEPVLIKVANTYDLEQGENYEFVLYGVKEDGKTYSQNEIFENFEIIDIRKTDKQGLDQTQDF